VVELSPMETPDASLRYRGDTSLMEHPDASPGDDRDASGQPSLEYSSDASPMEERDACAWCRSPLEETARADSIYCSKKCRQTAWRFRRQVASDAAALEPKRLAYADPPYPGMAWMYRDQDSFAGEVDHVELVAWLQTFDGWALSTSADALRFVLPLCPAGARVAPWVKPHGVPPTTRGAHNCWEPIIYKPARGLRPGFRDWLRAMPARGGGTLVGRKPIKFCAFMLRLIGAAPIDTLVDRYPGTGVVGRAFAELQRNRGTAT
jgi:hypothetical protein